MNRQNRVGRFLRHLLSGPWRVRRFFSDTAMRNIEAEIRHNETSHTGEIRFAVEAALHPLELMTGKTPRQRAIELFAAMNVWDTEANNGVLIYLLLADHDVEIVADRGINRHVGAQGWEVICHEMEAAFRRGEFEAGTLKGIRQIGKVLLEHFPADGANKNELPDAPLVL
jgi:uncharacterized membrane protein